MDIRVGFADNELFGFWNNDDAVINGVVNTTKKFAASELRAVGVFDAATPPPIRPTTGPAAGASWDWMGVAPGEPIYILPSGGIPATLPYLGFSTEDPSTSSFDEIRISLIGMTGPSGSVFSLYTSSPPAMNTLNGPSGSVTLENGEHQHFNWAFSQLGTYDLTFQFEDPTNAAVTGSSVFRFQIVDSVTAIPEPASTLLLSTALIGFGVRAARRRMVFRKVTDSDLSNGS